LVVSINDEGEIFLQETKVTVDELLAKLKAITQARPGGLDERIFVRGSRKINYGTVMQVMGKLSATGFKRVALVTELEQGS
jgi:biopolymer transport protein TolR